MWITVIIRFVMGNIKPLLIGAGSLIFLTVAWNVINGWLDARADRAILECNEGQLADQITVLEDLLARQLRDNDLQAQELEVMNREAADRRDYINRLEDVLNNNGIPDDEISERTREFWRQLNEEAKEIQNESSADS